VKADEINDLRERLDRLQAGCQARWEEMKCGFQTFRELLDLHERSIALRASLGANP
jgi:hypothetical protein